MNIEQTLIMDVEAVEG